MGAAAVLPDGRRIGNGFRDALWPDAPTLAVLDAATGDIPTYLINADVHSVWLNTAALRREGFEPDETGMLREEPAFEISRRLNAVDAAISDPLVTAMAQDAASRGVVGLVDLDMAWNEDAWARRLGAGFDLLRVEFGIYPQFLDRAIAEGLRIRRPGARGLVRPRPRRTAQGDHGRVARHPHGRVLARVSGRSAQPRDADGGPADARRPHDARDRCRAASRSTRSATSPTPTHSTRSRRRARGASIEHAQLVGARRHPAVRPARRLGERAARARHRRPRHHRFDLGRSDRAALSAARPRRHRRQPAVRLGCPGLAARSVGGDGGRGLPHPRRPRAVAAAAGCGRRDGPRRIDPRRLHRMAPASSPEHAPIWRCASAIRSPATEAELRAMAVTATLLAGRLTHVGVRRAGADRGG